MARSEDAHLGMGYGTAMNRLRKNVLFRLVQDLGRDDCFKCGLKIATALELSLEHKIPWNGDAELFWDLDNIAFSHRACNRPLNPGGRGKKRTRGCRVCGSAEVWRANAYCHKHFLERRREKGW